MSDLLLPFALFCLVTLFTPGPNNLTLMTSGLNFGLRRTLPHLAGVVVGFTLLVLGTGLGLGALFARAPLLYVVLKYAGAAYLIYLAWCIAAASPKANAPSRKRPMRFFEAFAFQWINPKSWAMAVGGCSTYAGLAAFPYNMVLIAGIFGLLGISSSFAWAGLGLALKRFLHKPKLVRTFNVTMAILLILSLYPVFADLWK